MSEQSTAGPLGLPRNRREPRPTTRSRADRKRTHLRPWDSSAARDWRCRAPGATRRLTGAAAEGTVLIRRSTSNYHPRPLGNEGTL